MTQSDVVAEWATWMRAGGTAGGTIELRCWHVRKVLREVQRPAQEIRVGDLVRYFGSQVWKPNTRRSYRSSLRSFFGWLHDGGLVEQNAAGLLPRVRVPRALPRPTPEVAYRAAMLSAEPRVRLMLQLGAVLGLRRGEISRVRREDLFEDLEGHALRVLGKGGHERHVPLPAGLAAELLAAPPGWVFPSRSRPGPLTAAHVGKLVSTALPDPWTCHTLRHRCATVGYWDSNDIRAVQELLGHLSADTTQIYTQVRRSAVRAVVDAAAAA